MENIKNAIARIWVELFIGKPGEKSWLDRNIAACRIVCLVALALFYCYEIPSWFNMDIRELNRIAEKKSQVGKEFQRREDLIRNLDNIVNHYAQHEQVLFQHVSDMRAQLQFLASVEGRPSVSQNAKIEEVFLRLSALAEQYPDLKAEQRFHDLMDMAEVTENRIADKMDDYVEAIRDYNTCNQCYWCNYFTYPLVLLKPLPAYWEFYHTERQLAPVVAQEELLEKEKAP